MKTKILILLSFLSLNLTSFGQMCGTEALESVPSSQMTVTMPQYLSTSNSICFNVYYHILRNDSGFNGYNPDDLDQITTTLNNAFNQHNIYVSQLGYDFIDNSNLAVIDDFGSSTAEFDELVQINNNPNAINIYLVINALQWIGKADGILSQAIVIENQHATSHIVSHEVGHCLNLWHTFQGTATNSSGCPEAIDGSNCETCGDFVCDTPADANIGASGGYNPDLTNIMSYYQPFDHFTNGQANRAKEAFASSSILQQIVSNNCSVLEPELSSIDSICYPDLKTIYISNYGNNLVSWQVSSNVTIISSTESSATISAKFANSSGNAWVKATLSESNIILTEYFEVGVPMVSYITLESFRSDPIYTDRWTNITAKYNGIIDVGQLGYTWEWIVPSHQVRYNGDNISYIHVNPLVQMSSVYIKTRASNECGCSDWKGKWFTVEDPPSGCTSCPTKPGEIHY